jgi:hypothetical protein
VYDDPLYRKRLAEIIPSLKQIDANLVGSLTAHGIRPVPGLGLAETEEQRLRRLQEAIIERAKAETKGNISNAK